MERQMKCVHNITSATAWLIRAILQEDGAMLGENLENIRAECDRLESEGV